MSNQLRRFEGQGNVFLRKRAALWQISYSNGWRQVLESSCSAQRAETLRTLKRAFREIALGKSADAERVRIFALLQLVIEDYRCRDRADLQEAEQRINRLLNPEFGHLRAAAFTTKALNAYISRRQKEGRQNSTINRELALLRRSFRLGYEHDPQLVFRLPVIKTLPEDNVREGFLEADKYKLILDALTDEIKPVFVVAYHLGMRTGELLAIKRSWVDLEESLIYVNGRVMKNRNPKTAPIYGDMKPWLEMLLRHGQIESPQCVWLFSRNGKPVKDFKADWKDACEKAGVPDLLFHDLRRTAVRNMIRAGVPEEIAVLISGHKTASMLWRYNMTAATGIKDSGNRINFDEAVEYPGFSLGQLQEESRTQSGPKTPLT
ncbi:MAG: tyrosine-type recombinase/integrase [Bryobacteraceae bacterium]